MMFWFIYIVIGVLLYGIAMVMAKSVGLPAVAVPAWYWLIILPIWPVVLVLAIYGNHKGPQQ